MTRGDASDINTDDIRNMDYFNQYNENTTYSDETLKNLILNPPINYNN
jgi:hypothetical protein